MGKAVSRMERRARDQGEHKRLYGPVMAYLAPPSIRSYAQARPGGIAARHVCDSSAVGRSRLEWEDGERVSLVRSESLQRAEGLGSSLPNKSLPSPAFSTRHETQ